MPDSLPLCVIDTSVLINLHTGGVLQALFYLPVHLSAPNVLVEELVEPDGPTLVTCGLTSYGLSSDETLEVQHLRARYHGPSVNDLFALVLAKTLDATLLTGDAALRSAAEQEGVPTHGALWLLDEMVCLAVIPPQLAGRALERMLAKGSRLPSGECEERLNRWRRP
jgi:predicted nucleic acid-binding protein